MHPRAKKKWFGGIGNSSHEIEGASLPMLERLKTFFGEERVAYRVIPHLEVYTASEVAESIHAPGRRFVKVVIVSAGGEEVMAVLPSHRQIDFSLLAEHVGKGELILEEESEIEKRFPGCEAGAVPPFGEIYGIPVYCDAMLAREPVIFFRAGSHREVIEIRYQDFIRLAQATVCHFVMGPMKKVSGF